MQPHAYVHFHGCIIVPVLLSTSLCGVSVSFSSNKRLSLYIHFLRQFLSNSTCPPWGYTCINAGLMQAGKCLYFGFLFVAFLAAQCLQTLNFISRLRKTKNADRVSFPPNPRPPTSSPCRVLHALFDMSLLQRISRCAANGNARKRARFQAARSVMRTK